MISALQKLQANPDYLQENNYNARVRDMMPPEYICKDETRQGSSENWIKSGKLDLLIQNMKTGKDLAIFEELRLSDFGRDAREYLDRHLNKLMDNYNANGLPYLYLVSYVSWSKKNFAALADEYHSYISAGSKSRYPVKRVKTLEAGPGQFMKCWEANYSCGSTPFTVIHIVVRMGR